MNQRPQMGRPDSRTGHRPFTIQATIELNSDTMRPTELSTDLPYHCCLSFAVGCGRLLLGLKVVTRAGMAQRPSRAGPAAHEAGKLNGGAVKVQCYFVGTVYGVPASKLLGQFGPCHPAHPASVCNNKDMMNQLPQNIDITFWTGERVRSSNSLARKHGPTHDRKKKKSVDLKFPPW